jgi:DNA repair protein RadC
MTATSTVTGIQYPLAFGTSKRSNARRFRRLTTLRLVRECSFNAPDGYPADDTPISSPRDVFARMTPYAEREPVEVFWLLSLNAQHRLIGNAPQAVTRGILNSSLVHPREVFVYAIVARAAAVVLCHNHPSGDPSPSADDRAVTDQLVAAGKLLDIPVMDHVIIGRGRYTSFAEAGLL